MLRNARHLTAAALFLAVSGTALMAASDETGSGKARCEIRAIGEGGMITLEGLVHAEEGEVTGSYMFRVETVAGSGSSNIRQGGGFSAAPGRPATLGRVMLGGRGSVFEATLDVQSSVGKFTCSERAGAL